MIDTYIVIVIVFFLRDKNQETKHLQEECGHCKNFYC